MSEPLVPRRLAPLVSNRYWREEDAERVLGLWSQSGLTLSTFARQCGLSVRRLYRWRTRLETSAGPRFHPIEIVPDGASPEASSEDSGVEIVHASGHRIAVRRDFDAGALTQLLEVLEAQLYRVETLADERNASPDERRALRDERSTTILERLDRWLVRTLASEPPACALHKACAYLHNHWDALLCFLEDGRIELDNNRCERQIRRLAMGRRNYLFAGSDAGAERAAVLYSVLGTAALAGVDPLAYLTEVIDRIAGGWPMRRLDQLLPQNFAPPASEG